MNILITSIGRRVSLLRAFQKELKARFPESIVFAADAAPQLSAACQVAEASLRVPLVSDKNYIPFLLQKCRELDIRIIIPTIDTELEVLAKNLNIFEDAGILPIVSGYNFISKCRNKRVIHLFFEQHGIDVAREFSKTDYKLPLFIKPEDGSRSIDTFIIRKEQELKEIHFKNEKLMFLEYLDHTEYEEFTCDLYYDREGVLRCVVPRKRIEVRSGEVNKGVTVKNEIVPLLRTSLGKISGAKGCLTAQFFRHKKTAQIFGIEINARFGGGFPLSYLAGANFPAWIIEEYLMNKNMADQFDCWEPDLLMMRYDDEILVHGYKD
jgi:carbamoyl-phosphate synthase large subunit